MQSQVRQNFHLDTETAINKLIGLEYYTSYVYLAMSYYFERDDVAQENFAKFFHGLSETERKHAEDLIEYQRERGGRVQLESMEKPGKQDWRDGLEATQYALELQKTINKSLLELHQLASKKEDPQMCHFLESHFLNSCVEIIKRLGDHITILRKLSKGQNSGLDLGTIIPIVHALLPTASEDGEFGAQPNLRSLENPVAVSDWKIPPKVSNPGSVFSLPRSHSHYKDCFMP